MDGAKEHYILDIEHSDKAIEIIEIIETLLPAIPYPKKKRSETDEGFAHPLNLQKRCPVQILL